MNDFCWFSLSTQVRVTLVKTNKREFRKSGLLSSVVYQSYCLELVRRGVFMTNQCSQNTSIMMLPTMTNVLD